MSQGDFNDFLTDRDKILMAAWTLPNEGPLTEAQRKQAMGNFAQYIRRRGLNYGDVARQVGKPSVTTIRDLCLGTFREGCDAHVRTLNNWVEQHARAQAVKLKGEFVLTYVAKQIQAVARVVRENQTMGLATGPTGIGKTYCAQALHETISGSILVTAMFGATHPKGLARLIADAIGVRDAAVSRSEMNHLTQVERVVYKLKDSARLVIVDEAHKLQEGAIELLREIHDAAGVPILLLATRDLADRIERSANPDRGQLYSRIDIVWPLTEGRDLYAGGDNKLLYSIDDIRRLYEIPPIRLSKDGARYLEDVANRLGHGSLRSCGRILRNAARRARKRQELDEEAPVMVTADDLEHAETRLRKSAFARESITERRRLAAGVAG